MYNDSIVINSERKMAKKNSFKKFLVIFLVTIFSIFFLLQLIPYGRNHQNPPVTNPVQWTDTQAEKIARRACYDCHSNETVWPWYANIAPGSWLIQRDVDEGRLFMNFSTGEGISANEISEVLGEGEMPPPQYLLLHSDARLDSTEKGILVNGLP
jgi:hypothetical protein